MRRQLTSAGMVRIAALAATLVLGATYEAVHQASLTSITNGDFWWHLRIGLGILQTHHLPHTGLYSQSETSSWMASSWLYDLAIAMGYQLIGLRIVLVTAVLFKLALAGVAFVLTGGLRGRFWISIVLTILAEYLLAGLQPSPLCCSALALAGLLTILLHYRRTANPRSLYSLPLLFLLWANLDIQFIYGVLVLLLFLAACALENVGSLTGTAKQESQIRSLRPLIAVACASVLATLITPYWGKPYGLFVSQAIDIANSYFPDYQSLRFRTPQDYLLLLLVMAAFLALGMRRSRDVFQIGLLALFTALAFRSQRNEWLVIIVAVAILANAIPEGTPSEQAGRVEGRQFGMAACLALMILAITLHSYAPRTRADLIAKIGGAFPVKAADYIRDQHLPQPLFNPLPWGGFLTWYLPEYPVAVDGRTDLYGPDFNIQYAKLMNAEVHFSTFPPFNDAHTILLEKNSLMGTALPKVAGFTVVYADDIAVVLVRQEHEP